jgi:peroxiredoxin
MRRMRAFSAVFMLSFLVMVAVLPCAAVLAQSSGVATGVEAVPFGQPFPPGTYANFNVQAGGPERIDLAQTLGKKPVILFYWIAGNPRADAIFKQLEALTDELGSERIALYGVAMERPGRERGVIVNKLQELKITVPVLDDRGFRIGQKLRVQSVPNITILDRDGILRMTNGATLTQELEYKMNVEGAIRRVAEKGTVSTYGFLARYYPVTEMVGKKCPDFQAALLSTDKVQSWYSMLSGDKVNVLVFWSLDCPHCRRELPEINEWLKQNPDGVNVVSVVRAPNDAVKVKTREFIEANGLVFPTLVDPGADVAGLFEITSTPTSVIIRPDGVVDSVLVSSIQDFGRAVEKTKRESLGSGSPD